MENILDVQPIKDKYKQCLIVKHGNFMRPSTDRINCSYVSHIIRSSVNWGLSSVKSADIDFPDKMKATLKLALREKKTPQDIVL